MDGRDGDLILPDFATLRVLPYVRNSAILLGNFVSPETRRISDLCCRGLLCGLVEISRTQHGISFNLEGAIST